MFPFEDFRDDALTLTPAAFAGKYASHFLVHNETALSGRRGEMEWATVIGPPPTDPPTDDLVSDELKSWAIPIRKRPGNPHPDRMSIGRARSCDLVVRYGFVSKLHAHLMHGEDGFVLRDLGSANGTKVAGRPLAPMQSMPIQPGDLVSLGQVEVEIVDAMSFQTLLAAGA